MKKNNTSNLQLNQDENIVSESQNGVGLTLDNVRQMIKQAKTEVLKEAKVEIDKQIQTSQVSSITIIGLFASIISFLTIEFQFLKTLNNIQQITGFTLLLFSLLFGFNIGLDYLIKSRFDSKTSIPNFLFCGGVFMSSVLGTILIILGR